MRAFLLRRLLVVVAWVAQRLSDIEAARSSTGESSMSLEDLKVWADRNDMMLVDQAEFDAHCAKFARLIVETTDLDLEHRILFGDA